MIGKAEWTDGAADPRFIVTNNYAVYGPRRFRYEDVCTAKSGEMEKRRKECQGDLVVDRTTAPTIRASQLRL